MAGRVGTVTAMVKRAPWKCDMETGAAIVMINGQQHLEVTKEPDYELGEGVPQVGWPAGHFYSPLPAIPAIKNREAEIFTVPDHIDGVNLRVGEQLALFEDFVTYYADLPFTEQPQQGVRYYFENDFFSYGDAIALHCMIRHVKPKRVIEVGSGFSSCVTLDTNDRFFDGQIACTFIEPYPDTLLSLVSDADLGRVKLLRNRVQDVDVQVFRQLEAGDILFIDSTHVSKVGSDVNRLLFQVLPALNDGVVVHVHDIFYPFEYPKEWIYEGRAWNEAYLLRAFLQYSDSFRITYWPNYLNHFHQERFRQRMPLCLRNMGASIWLERKAH